MSDDTIQAIFERHAGEHGELISILQDIQAEHGYLSEQALRMVAAHRQRSLVDVYGVATFYRCFSLKPRGRHLLTACTGTACHVRGAAQLVARLEQELGVKAGETTPDGQFTLERVNCLGACALGPILVVDGHYFSRVDGAELKRILTSTCGQRAKPLKSARPAVVPRKAAPAARKALARLAVGG